MKFKLLSLVLFFIVINYLNADAQTFKWQASLEKIPSNGFYKLLLAPQIISTTENTSLSDIRIFEKDKEIAYLIKKIPDSIYKKDSTALGLQNYTIIPAPVIKVNEDKANQRTIVEITFNAAYQIDKLILSLEGFRYYRRAAWITEQNPMIREKKNRYHEERLENFSISSEKPPIVKFYNENRYKRLFLVIENEDNEPLTVKNIKAYQKNIELITYLEKDKQYIMKTGQLNMQLPRYDLGYFKDSISSSIPLIKITALKKYGQKEPIKESKLIKKSVMWGALGILILFLGYLSYYMVKDMQRKKQIH